MKSAYARIGLVATALVVGTGCSWLVPTKPEPSLPQSFPAAGFDVVHHDLRVDLFTVGEGGAEKRVDSLSFDGRMVVERESPFVDRDRRRVINFRVRTWEAYAWSDFLETLVVYRLSEDLKQPLSTIRAEQTGRDFPATFTFNVVFDAIAYGQVIFRQQKGRPEGRGFRVVPPDGNRERSPTITSFEDMAIEFEDPRHGLLRLKPVDCNDRESKTLKTFTGAHSLS